MSNENSSVVHCLVNFAKDNSYTIISDPNRKRKVNDKIKIFIENRWKLGEIIFIGSKDLCESRGDQIYDGRMLRTKPKRRSIDTSSSTQGSQSNDDSLEVHCLVIFKDNSYTIISDPNRKRKTNEKIKIFIENKWKMGEVILIDSYDLCERKGDQIYDGRLLTRKPTRKCIDTTSSHVSVRTNKSPKSSQSNDDSSEVHGLVIFKDNSYTIISDPTRKRKVDEKIKVFIDKDWKLGEIIFIGSKDLCERKGDQIYDGQLMSNVDMNNNVEENINSPRTQEYRHLRLIIFKFISHWLFQVGDIFVRHFSVHTINS